MSEQTSRIKATINGSVYTIVGHESQTHMLAAAQLVDEQFAELLAQVPDFSEEKVAVLVAVNAVSDQMKKAAELTQLKDQLAQLQAEIKMLKHEE